MKLRKQAQLLDETNQYSIAILTEMATNTNTTVQVLCEDVLNVLTNLVANVETGKGLVAMGGNANNYAYFLAGLASIVQKMIDPQNPAPPEQAKMVLQKLSGCNIAGGLINQGCQPVVDFGALPKNQALAQSYLQLVKDMVKNPAPLINAIGKLKIAIGRVKTSIGAQEMNTPPAAKGAMNTPPAAKGAM